MRNLIDLKNIIAKQLPRMPRNYIVRLTMDRQHEAMIIRKKIDANKTVILGGCVFRPFLSQRFAEIVFLAISTSEQVKGYGTRLMNRLKAHAQTIGIQYFVTYADNNAIEYFRKQGFTKHHQMAESRFKGYIKDYSGSTMMQCKIHTGIDYENISSTIKMQRDSVIAKIHEIMNQKIYKALDFSRRGANDFEFNEIEGLIEAGWTQRAYNEAKGTEEKTFEEQCADILKALYDHENAWPFRTAVSPKQAPDYYTVITEPMWLEKIKQNLDRGMYHRRDLFKNDVRKIFDNARIYNAKDTIFYKFADILQAFAQPLLDKLKETKEDTDIRKKRQARSKLDA